MLYERAQFLGFSENFTTKQKPFTEVVNGFDNSLIKSDASIPQQSHPRLPCNLQTHRSTLLVQGTLWLQAMILM